eukprot:sb/3466686/
MRIILPLTTVQLSLARLLNTPGNTILKCKGSKWSSKPATCIAENSNCGSFEVTNGKLSNADPYFTNDVVKISCDTDYSLKGTSPRKCQTAGWKTSAPTCEKQDNECVSLSAPDNGAMSCSGQESGKNVAGTNCTATCNEGYVNLSDETSAICSKKLQWSTQTASNTLGEFAPCTEVIEPKGRSVKNKVSLITQYCTTDAEKSKISTALSTFLSSTLAVDCLVSKKCELGTVDCWYRTSYSDTRLVFTLDQKEDLTVKSILNQAKKKIKTSVKSETFVLSISDKKRKKRATSLSADKDSLEATDEVECADGEALSNGQCECHVCYTYRV